jgi:hypothetical protein
LIQKFFLQDCLAAKKYIGFYLYNCLATKEFSSILVLIYCLATKENKGGAYGKSFLPYSLVT